MTSLISPSQYLLNKLSVRNYEGLFLYKVPKPLNGLTQVRQNVTIVIYDPPPNPRKGLKS